MWRIRKKSEGKKPPPPANGALRGRGGGRSPRSRAPRREFTPPRPGTYRLQKIQPTTDATLLDPSGRPVRLSAETTGKITLLTFFYTYCTDPIGCPLAYRTLLEVRTGVGRVAGLERRGRFLNGSLDPTTHTPAAIGNNRER